MGSIYLSVSHQICDFKGYDYSHWNWLQLLVLDPRGVIFIIFRRISVHVEIRCVYINKVWDYEDWVGHEHNSSLFYITPTLGFFVCSGFGEKCSTVIIVHAILDSIFDWDNCTYSWDMTWCFDIHIHCVNIQSSSLTDPSLYLLIIFLVGENH